MLVVGGDSAKSKWRRAPKRNVVTVCCARDALEFAQLQKQFDEDKANGLVKDDQYHFVTGVGPPTSSTLVRSILREHGIESTIDRLKKIGYPETAATFLLEERMCVRKEADEALD